MDKANYFSELFADSRYALRAIRNDPSLFLFATAIVGIGIGACTAIFSLISPLMLQELPFEEPDRLVWIANTGNGEGMSAVTSRTSNLRDFRAQSQSFEALTGYFAFFEHRTYNLISNDEPEQLHGVDVAHDFLDVLGVQPIRGRNFTAEEGLWDGPSAVILSHRFWTRRFAADPAILGTSITLDQTPSEVVGVLPPTFDFASTFAPHTRIDFLRPFPISDETDQWGNTLSIIGRLEPGATVTSAQADLDSVLEGLRQEDPERWGLGAAVSGLQSHIAGPFRSALLLLAGAAFVVLLIVCVNLSNLLLAKAARRRNEMATRSALGAPRHRLVRQLLLEGLLLSASGTFLGILIATVTVRFVASHSALDIPLAESVSVDGPALLFSAILALATTLLFGWIPAHQTTNREALIFREASRGSTASKGSTRLREGLVIAEVALACVLLVFGGLLIQSFQNVLDVDLGFQPDELVAWNLAMTRQFEDLPSANAYFEQLIDRVEAVPGVVSVGLTDAIPFGRNRTWGVSAPGMDYDGQASLSVFPHIVDSRYLQTLQVPLLQGRYFTADDTGDRQPVIILNELAARALFKGEPALDRIVQVGDRDMQVIGIVGGVRHRTLEDGSGRQMYFSYSQIGDFGTPDLVVRSNLPVETLAPSIQAALKTHDPQLPTRDYRTFNGVIDLVVSPRRFTVQLLGTFASAALLLAALGIYSVLSYAVSERVREIGIRMALGETSRRVLLKVVGKTALLAGIGLGLGTLGSMVASRWAESLLYSVQPSDPGTLLATAAILLAVSVLAGLVPAWRACRTDIVSVLKA